MIESLLFFPLHTPLCMLCKFIKPDILLLHKCYILIYFSFIYIFYHVFICLHDQIFILHIYITFHKLKFYIRFPEHFRVKQSLFSSRLRLFFYNSFEDTIDQISTDTLQMLIRNHSAEN